MGHNFAISDHPPSSVDILNVMTVDKNGKFETTYPFTIAHVVFEWPLSWINKLIQKTTKLLLHANSQILIPQLMMYCCILSHYFERIPEGIPRPTL